MRTLRVSRPRGGGFRASVAIALLLAACAAEDDGDGTGQTDETDRDIDRTRDVGGAPDVDGSDSTVPDSRGDLGATPDEGTVGTTPEVDPGCIDGQYAETLPRPSVSVTDELAAYSEANLVAFIDAALEKRYPIGAFLVAGGLANQARGDCVDEFLDDGSSGEAVIDELSTLVHECGHYFDSAESELDTAAFVITPELRFDCSGGGTQGFGPDTFARSLLNDDEYAALRPPCSCCGQGCDFYATLYLDGDPDNAVFEFGDLGFDSVLEEAVQYVNSLATAFAFNDFISGFISERDGILTHLWYIERYLRLARLEHPDAYALLSENACWREAILTVWGRAWLMLEATEDLPQLALDDEALLGLVRDPDLLGEIERLRTAAGCP